MNSNLMLALQQSVPDGSEINTIPVMDAFMHFLPYLVGMGLFIVFVCFRVRSPSAVSRGAIGATNGSANLASFFLLILVLVALRMMSC